MANKLKIIRPVLKLAVGCLASLLTTTSVLAQSAVLSHESKQTGHWIGDTIVKENLVTETASSIADLKLEEKPSNEKIRTLLVNTHGIVSISNKLNPSDILKIYNKTVSTEGTHRDIAVYKLYDLYLTVVDTSNRQKADFSHLIEALEDATKNEDWFIANTGWLLLAQLNSSGDNLNLALALEQAQRAYKIIPNEISSYVDDARILTLVQTAYLHNIMLNTELAIDSTAELIRLKQEANYPVDGSSLLNNLIYSLSSWREYEISTKLAKDALEIEEKFGSNEPGLTELRVSRLLNNQGKFSEALDLIDRGLANVEYATIRKNLSFARITALAGIGKTEQAQKELKKLTGEFSTTESQNNYRNITAAKAAIAIAKGNRSQAFSLTTAVNDATIQGLLTKYNTNTSELLANLENSKDRQAEREAALETQAELKQEQLEQQQSINRLLIILLGLLGTAALSAFAFARYRDKISKALEIKTMEAESADRMKSEFLGMVSHELRTPLNGIVGIADLLSNTAPTDDLRHKAGIILDSSVQLTSVVDSIVDMSRIDGGKMELYPEMTDVHGIVMDLDQLWRPTLENKGITFTCFADNSLNDEVLLDKARFRQCLNNLLSNAAKFTDTGRVHLHVTAAPVEDSEDVEITAIVADTGQGITEDVQARLFTPFLQADSSMTRKHGGSGISLSITQSLARMMGGDVTLVSNAGRGSEFTLKIRGEKSESAQVLDEMEALLNRVEASSHIEPPAPVEIIETNALETIPAKMEHMPATELVFEDSLPEVPIMRPVKDIPKDVTAQPQSQFDPDNLRGLKVLIVEDIPANQDVIKLFLNPEGCESLCAMNGQEALQILESQAIDVIIMDIRMPEMDGIEATRTIRQSDKVYRNIPIIALTADVSAQTNAECMAAGADIFLTKPVMARDLTEAIRFLRRFQDADEQDVDAIVNLSLSA